MTYHNINEILVPAKYYSVVDLIQHVANEIRLFGYTSILLHQHFYEISEK